MHIYRWWLRRVRKENEFSGIFRKIFKKRKLALFKMLLTLATWCFEMIKSLAFSLHNFLQILHKRQLWSFMQPLLSFDNDKNLYKDLTHHSVTSHIPFLLFICILLKVVLSLATQPIMFALDRNIRKALTKKELCKRWLPEILHTVYTGTIITWFELNRTSQNLVGGNVPTLQHALLCEFTKSSFQFMNF